MRLPGLYKVVHAEWPDEDAPAIAHGRAAVHLRCALLRDAVHSRESPLSRAREQPVEARRQVRREHDARRERGGATVAGEVPGGARGQEYADQKDAAT